LLDGCEKMQDYERGVEIFKYVRKFIYPSLMSFSIIMKIFGKRHDYESSRDIMKELRRNKENISIIIYTCYIRTCMNANKCDEAMAVYKEILSKNISPDEITFNTLIVGFHDKHYVDYTYTVLCDSLQSEILLRNQLLYKKCLGMISKSYEDEKIVGLLEKIEYLTGEKYDSSKYLKDWQLYDSKKRNSNNNHQGQYMKYCLEHYKHKTEDTRRRKDQNQAQKEKIFKFEGGANGTFTNEKFLNDVSKVVFKDENVDESNRNNWKVNVSGSGKGNHYTGKKAPLSIVSSVNSMTTGFERGTKLSNKVSNNDAGTTSSSNIVVSINENLKKNDNNKQFKFNRF